MRQVETNKNDIVRLQKTDFTKKGAQRLAAFAFMRQFNKESQQALDWSIEIAKEKLEKSDGVDKVGVDILIVPLGECSLDSSIPKSQMAPGLNICVSLIYCA